MTTKTKKTAATKRTATKTTAKKTERVSMWGAARDLIKAGRTNAEVLAMLRERFKLPQARSFYAVWYRSYAVRHGIVTKAFVKAHAGPPLVRKPATA